MYSYSDVTEKRAVTMLRHSKQLISVNNDCTRNRGTVISVWSVPTSCNEDQLPLLERLETADTRERGWCKMAASMQRREPGCRGTPNVGSRY
jgi:hypothetical protein